MLAAEQHEGPACPHDPGCIVPPKVRNCFEVGGKPPQQPHQFDIAPALAFQLAARTNLVEVPVDIELQKIARVIAGPPGRRRCRSNQAEPEHIETFNKGIDHPHRRISGNVIIDPCRQKTRLVTVPTSNVAHDKGRIIDDAASLSDLPQFSHSLDWPGFLFANGPARTPNGYCDIGGAGGPADGAGGGAEAAVTAGDSGAEGAGGRGAAGS